MIKTPQFTTAIHRLAGPRRSIVALAMVLAGQAAVAADFNIAVGVDPADDNSKQTQLLGMTSGPAISAALGFRVLLKQTSNLGDVMRASRTQENDVLIGPPQIVASAISHGYRMLARDPRSTQFVLVVRPDIKSLVGLAGKRLYLTQQDSMRAYMARSLLAEADFDLRKIGQVVYGKNSGAGLLALQSGLAEATVVEQAEAADWIKKHPGGAAILKTSRTVPAGNAVVVLSGMAETDQRNLLRWATSADASGIGKLQDAGNIDPRDYRYIASLSAITPPAIAGVTLVDASEIAALVSAGAVLVDTRTAREFERGHITGAMNLPYIEHSVKDKDFDATQDSFAELDRISSNKAVIFYCNGPDCWKSYKASRTAGQRGYKKVYWYRKGWPDWRDKNMPVAKQP